MARSGKTILNFNGGEVSPLLDARSDLLKTGNACRTLTNMTADVEGGARRRAGFRYISQVKGYDNSWRWIIVQSPRFSAVTVGWSNWSIV